MHRYRININFLLIYTYLYFHIVVIELQKKWKNLRDTYKKKWVTQSGQAANKKKNTYSRTF